MSTQFAHSKVLCRNWTQHDCYWLEVLKGMWRELWAPRSSSIYIMSLLHQSTVDSSLCLACPVTFLSSLLFHFVFSKKKTKTCPSIYVRVVSQANEFCTCVLNTSFLLCSLQLRGELEQFDPSFFEEIEDLKYNYREAMQRNVQYEEELRNLSQQFGVTVHIPP